MQRLNRQPFKRYLGATACVVSALLILWWVGLPQPATPAPREGAPLPPFQQDTIGGNQLTIDAELGSPLVINFWATWCIPCAEEMPILQRLFEQGVPVVGINAEQGSGADARAWLVARDITFPNVADDEEALQQLYQVRSGLPVTFFADDSGVIRQITLGALTEESLATGLAAIGFD